MIKNPFRQDKERYAIPKAVQDIIPVNAVYQDGVFLSGKQYSKTYQFTDINYSVASPEDQETMFFAYSDLLNSLDTGATAQITLYKHHINADDYNKTVLLPFKNDGLNQYRDEINGMLQDKMATTSAMQIDKYITLSISKNNIEDARTAFARMEAGLTNHFARLGSHLAELNATERLRLLHSFYRSEEITAYQIDLAETLKRGHDFRDYICPDTFENSKDHFQIGEQFGRVLFLRDYANSISDSFLSKLLERNCNMILSIDIIPIPADKANRTAENKLIGVEKNIVTWQQSQNRNNNFSAVIPPNLEQQREECRELLSDLTERDQRLFFGTITLVHMADNRKQLDTDTEAILAIARENICQLAILKYQQLDGLQTVLPYGQKKIHAVRTLTTESLTVFMPFEVQEVRHKNGIYIGQNVISKNMLFVDRAQLQNGNEIICGIPGSGKSMTGKLDMILHRLSETDDCDILIIDPEREVRQEVA